MPTTNRASRTSASASCPSLIVGVAAAEAGLHHHLLAVVRPALDERRRREEASTCAPSTPPAAGAGSAGSAPGYTSWIEMFQSVGKLKSRMCSFWRSGGQRAIDVGQVVVGAARLALERAGRPHAGERPAVELRRRRHDDRLRLGHRHDRLALQELGELLDLRLRRAAPACPARDAAPWLAATPRSGRRRSGGRRRCGTPPAPRCSSRSAIASRRSALSVMPSSSFSFCSNRSRPSRNDAFARGARSVSRYSM